MIDIAQTSGGDIELVNGDLTYNESTEQHQQDILVADQGHYKEFPDTGVDILNFLQDTDPENLLRTTRKQFTKDGMKVRHIGIKHNYIDVKAEYEDNNG